MNDLKELPITFEPAVLSEDRQRRQMEKLIFELADMTYSTSVVMLSQRAEKIAHRLRGAKRG